MKKSLLIIGIIFLHVPMVQLLPDIPEMDTSALSDNKGLVDRYNQKIKAQIDLKEKMEQFQKMAEEHKSHQEELRVLHETNRDLEAQTGNRNLKKTAQDIRADVINGLQARTPNYEFLKDVIKNNKFTDQDQGYGIDLQSNEVKQHNDYMDKLSSYIDLQKQRQDLFIAYGKTKAEDLAAHESLSLRDLHDNKFSDHELEWMQHQKEKLDFAQEHNKEMDRRMEEILKQRWLKYVSGFSKLSDDDQQALAEAAHIAYDKNPKAFDDGNILVLSKLLKDSIDEGQLSDKGRAFLQKKGRAFMMMGITGISLIVLGIIALIKVFNKHKNEKVGGSRSVTTSIKSSSAIKPATSSRIVAKSHEPQLNHVAKKAHKSESVMAKDFKKEKVISRWAVKHKKDHVALASKTKETEKGNVVKYQRKRTASLAGAIRSKSVVLPKSEIATSSQQDSMVVSHQAAMLPAAHIPIEPTGLTTGPIYVNPYGGSVSA